MNSRHLIDRFRAARDRAEPMVLVTVYATLGSTYSKAGTRMLITAAGESQGLISGGCLEGDLALRAASVLETNVATVVSYDLRDEADELFGLGVGCNGLIEVLLQPLRPESGYEPLATIAEVLMGEAVGALATVIDPGASGFDRGASVALLAGETRTFGGHAVPPAMILDGCRRAIESRQSSFVADSTGPNILYAPLVPIPRVLILGAGLDAVPLVNVLAELGWRVVIADHRPAYLSRSGFARAERCQPVKPTALGEVVSLAGFDAIVVMSHHLDTDREYLRQLAGVAAPYVGLLGPPARRRRLLEEIGADAADLGAHLRGPVGLDIGADSAESIALSIAAEIQAVLATVGGSGSRRTA